MLARTHHDLQKSQLTIAAIALILLSTAANAEIRYVAATGKDANPCTLRAPCKTLQRGVDVTPGGSELRVLSSGTYGAATLTRSLTLSGSASVTIVGRIIINAPGAAVVLRGLNLNGAGLGGVEGIYVEAVGSVRIERCEIERFGGHGILYHASDANISVSHSIARYNGLSGIVVYDDNATPSAFGHNRTVIEDSTVANNLLEGIYISGGTATITRVSLSGNGSTGLLSLFATVNISETTAVGNRYVGLYLWETKATVESSLAAGNQRGLAAGSNTSHVVTISNSVFVNNSIAGIRVSPAGRTRGNNTVVNNPTNVDGTLTPLPGF